MPDKNLFRKLMTRAFRAKKSKPIRKQQPLRVESLEDRVVPAFTLSGGDLTLGVADSGDLRNGTTMANFRGTEFFFPGTPYEEFSLGANGSVFRNYTGGGLFQIPGSTTNLSAGGVLGASFSGSASGLNVVRTFQYDSTGSTVAFTIQITNTTAGTISGVQFMEAADPDQGGSSVTANDVVTVGGGTLVRGTSTGGSPAGYTVGIGSRDPRASFTAESPWPIVDPNNVIGSPVDPNGASGDDALAVAFNFGDLAAGQTVVARYFMVFSDTAAGADALFAAAPTLQVEFDTSSASSPEGTGGNVPKLLVSGTSATPTTVQVNLTGGTATDGTDFTNVATVTIPAGTYDGTAASAVPINLTILTDGIVEADETVQLALTGLALGDADGGGIRRTHTYTIANDDTSNVTINNVSQAEGTTPGTTAYTFTVTSSAAVQGGFTVAYTTNDGTAIASSGDYVDNDGNLVFSGTAGETKTITVLVNRDSTVELDETFTVALGAISGTTAPAGSIVAGSAGTGTIVNDDASTIDIADVAVTEGNAGTKTFTFTVSLSNPVDASMSVFFATADGTATVADNDYVGTSGGILIGTGNLSQTLSVTVNGDLFVEPDETFLVNLTGFAAAGRNVSFAAGGTQAVGTILQDDTTGHVIFRGSGSNDLLTLNATGPDSANYELRQNNVVVMTGTLASLTQVDFLAGAGDDLLRINNPGGGLFAPSAGIFYDGGGQPGDAIENLGGAATSGSYRVGPGNGDGVIQHVGSATQTINFTGLAPATDTVAEPTYTIFATDAANSIIMSNGVSSVDGILQVAIDAFEPITFTNKTDVLIQGGDNVAGGDAGDTILINYTEVSTGLATVTVNAEDGVDLIRVEGTPAGIANNINGDAGADAIRIGQPGGSLDTVQGNVIVNGGTEADTITINDQGDADDNTYTITSGGVVRTPGTFGGLAYSQAESLQLNAGTGNDQVNIQSTAATTPVTLSTGAGTDTVNIGSATNALDTILGTVAVAGDAPATALADRVFVNDQGSAFAGTYRITNASLDRAGTTILTYGTIEQLTLNAALGDNTINVISTVAGTPVVVSGGGGNDTINVGDSANTLDTILGPVSVNGDANGAVPPGDTLNINDQSDTDANGYVVTNTAVTRNGAPVISYGTIETLTVNAGTQGDTIGVQSTAAGTVTTVNAGGGNDLVTVGNAGILDGIQGALSVLGQGHTASPPGDRLVLDDSAKNPGSAYTVTAATVSRNGIATITYDTTTEFLSLFTGVLGDMIAVQSTSVNTTVDGGTTADTFTIGNAGSLNGINSPLSIVGDGGIRDVLILDDTADGAANTFHITATQIGGGGPGGAVTAGGPFGAAGILTYSVEDLIVNAGGGANTFNVDSTGGASFSTTVNDGTGNSTFNIQGNGLAGGNTFDGGAGNDTFDVDIAAGTNLTGGMTINGGAPANTATGDTVSINDANAAARSVTITYLDAPNNGNVTIAGLGATMAVNTVEAIDYNGDGSNNDSVAVIDNSAAVNPARVTPSASGALYTRNGGVSGTEPGPDLDLSGLSSISLDGAAPTAVPGDRLVYAGPVPATKSITGTNTGTISAAGVIPVSFTSFEQVEGTATSAFNDVFNVPTNGTANTITAQLDATGTILQIFLQEGAGPNTLVSSQLLASVNSLTINGSGDSDRVVIDDVNGLPRFGGTAPGATDNANSPGVAGLLFNGSAGSDSLVFRLDAAGTSTNVINQTYAMGNGAGGGSGVGTSEGEILTSNATLGQNLIVYFTGLEPITTSGSPGGTLTILGDTNANTITIDNSPVAGNTRISATNPIFETFDFAANAYTALDVYGMGGADTINLVALNAGEVSLAAIRLDGDSNVGGDASADTIQVQSLPATSTANLFGGAGDDLFLVTTAATPFAGGTTGGILGPVNVSPAGDEGGNDTLAVNDTAGAGRTVLITATTIEGITDFTGAPDVTYGAGDQIETIDVVTSDAADDIINIQSTRSGSAYNVDTGEFGAGNDTVNISSDAPANAGNLNAIDGQINLSFGTGTDTLNVSDLGDAAGDTYTLNLAGGVTTLSFIDGAAPADIRYNTTFAGGVSSLDNFNLIGSNTGSNVYSINATTGTATNVISDGNAAGTGDSLFFIQADAVQSGAANTFSGNGGADTFAVNFAGGSSIPNAAGTTFVVNGGAQTSPTRDRVLLNATLDPATVRTVGFTYADPTKTSGDVNVSGLGTASVIDINSVETVTYSGDGSNNDILTVTGTTAADNLTVAPLSPSSTLVFLDGNPFDGPPELSNQLIGVASGTSKGPDLLLNGLATATGLTVNGGDATVGNNRLYVYGESENNLISPLEMLSSIDPFGFGSGVLIPGTGAGNAYDDILVSDSVVRFVDDVNAGIPTDVKVRTNIATATFAQNNALVPQPAGLVINAGDEAAPGAGGIADDILSSMSANFRIVVNGGEPPQAGAPNGDRLQVTTPNEINIFSDLNNPPNVSFNSTGFQQVGFSSIENLALTPGNGIVNVLGDNNNAATPQADSFIIAGDGARRFDLAINGSAPIQFLGVDALNVNGGQLDDTTAISPFATSVIPWNIVVTVDGQANGASGDRLIYTNVATLFDDVHLAATGVGAGRIDALGIGSTSTNQVVRFLGTEQVTLIANAGDGDAATIDLTNAADTANFLFDPSSPTTPAIATPPGSLPVPVVADDITLTNLFNVVLDTANYTGLTVNGQAANDTFVLNLVGAAGTLPIPLTVNGGTESDTITVIGNAGNDDFNNVPGANPAAGVVSITDTDTGAIEYTGVEAISYDGAGAGADTASITGTAGPDSITLVQTNGAAAGTVTASNQPAIGFANFGAGSDVSVNTLGGDDLLTVQQAINWGITAVNVDLGAQTANDTLAVVGTGSDDVFTFNPGTRQLTVAPAGGATVTYNDTSVETFNLDGAANTTASPGDFLNILSAMSGPALPPSGTLTATGLTVNYQNFESILVATLPTATNDAASVNEDSSVIIDVLGNDTIPNAPGSIQLVTLPTNGTVQVLAANDPANPAPTFGVRPVVRYTPNPNYFGSDSFTYRVIDANSQASPTAATVALTVNAVNDVPTFTVQNIPVTVNEDSGAQSVVIATNITPGGPSNPLEAGQVLTFNVIGNTNSALFAVQPSIAPNGTLTFTPAANANGTATITFNLSDDGGTANGGLDTTANQIFTITVNAVNDAPTVTAPATTSTNEDTPLTAAGISVADAADGNVGTFAVTLVVTNGTLSGNGFSGNGTNSITFSGTQAEVNAALATVLFTPTANFNGTAVLTTTVNDNGNTGTGGALMGSATTTITVNAVNDAPVNTLPPQTGTEDTTTPITGLSVADLDVGSGNVTVTLSVANGTLSGTGFTNNGTASIDLTGTLAAVNAALATVAYTPALNFTGDDTLTMATSDNGNTGTPGALTDTDSTTIAVAEVNDAPTIVVPDYSTNEDTPLAIDGIDVADVDSGASAVVVTLTIPAGTGTLAAASSGGVAVSGTGTNSLILTGTATALDAYLATGSGNVAYTPPLNFNGTVTLTGVVNDQGNTGSGGAQSGSDIGVITVVAVNDAPVAGDDSYATNEDTILGGQNVLSNDSDVEGDTLTVTEVNGVAGNVGIAVTGSSGGTFTIGSNGSLSFNPGLDFQSLAAGQTATTSVAYTVNDGNGGTDTATVTVTVMGLNDAPVATDDSFTTDEDTALSGPNVLSNDTDVDATDSLTVTQVNGGAGNVGTAVSGSGGGTFTIQSNGSLSFNPGVDFQSLAAGQTATTSVMYTVSDGNGGTDIATVIVTITGVNDAPVAIPESYSVAEDGTLTVAAPGVLANDTDVDGPAQTAVLVSTTPNGTLNLAADGSFTYTANLNFTGTDSFTYQVDDTAAANNLSNVVTVSITVTPVNDAPTVTAPATAATDEDTNVAFTGNISVADAADGNVGNFTVTLAVTNGTLSGSGFTGNGTANLTLTGTQAQVNAALATVLFTPTANFNGTAVLTTTVNDNGNTGTGGALMGSATSTITVNAVNDAPVNTLPPQTGTEDTTSAITGLSVADLDVGSGNVTVTLSVANGTLSGTGFNNNGTASIDITGTLAAVNAALATVAYTPNLNFTGNDTLTMVTSDNGNTGTPGALTDTDSTTIAVAAVNDAPVNTLPAQTGTEDTTTPIMGLLVADVDAGSGTITVTLSVTTGVLNGAGFTPASGATIAITGTLTAVNAALAGVTYTPPLNFNGTATLTMVTTDNGNTGTGGPLSDTDTTTITVAAVNDAPVANADSATTAEDAAVTFDPRVNDTDVEGDALTVTAVTQGANGAVAFTGTSVTYTPNANFNGTDSFTYTISDGNGGTATGTVSVTVTPVNDAPVNAIPVGPVAIPEDAPTVVAGISVSDLDAGAADIRVTLSVLNGTLAIQPTSGVVATGGGTGNITLTGPQASINAALATLTYTSALNYNGPDALTIVTNDLGNTGSGGPLVDMDTVAINVTAVNDAPVNTVPGPQTLLEDTTAAIPGLSVADIDLGAGTVTVTLSVLNGTLSGTGFNNNGTASIDLTGTLAAVNAALATVSYTPNANFSGTDTLTMATSDNGNTGTPGGLTDTDTVALNVTPVADAPTLAVTSPAAGTENVAIPLTINAALVDTDGSEVLSIEIVGVPPGVTFNQGTNLGSGTWRFTAGQLSGLTITVPDGPANFNLTVNAIAREQANGDTETTTQTLNVVVGNTNPTASLVNLGPVSEGSPGSVTVINQADPSQPDVVAGFRYAFDFNNDGDFLDVGESGGTYASSTTNPTASVPGVYLDDGPGSVMVRARVFDKDDGFVDVFTTITVNNANPTATFSVQGPFIERQPVTVVFSNPFDPSAADRAAGFTYSYDLDGDGIFEIANSTSPTAQFTPPSEGVFTVRGRIIDKDGGFTEYTATTPGSSGVAISNVDIFAVGTGIGGSPLVKVYNPNGTFKGSFFAYDPGFRGGVTVAVGDITGDGIPDIVTGTGPGGGPDVRIFDGATFRNIGGFLAYEQTYRGGLNVAVGDVDGDGQLDIVTGTGDGGGPIVGVFAADGTLKHRFATFDPDFRGGVNVAAGDINGDGHADIIAGAGDTGAPRVQVFSGANPATILSSFFAYDSSFRGGVFVSAGDVDGDGQVEIVTGTGRTGGPHLKVFDPSGAVEQSVFIFGPDRTTGLPLRNGFYVSAHTDLDGDAVPDILAAAGPEFAPVVHGAKGTTMEELLNFIAYEDDFTGGVYIG